MIQTKTQGEVLFEEYLTAQSLAFEFEEGLQGKAKRPDYRIDWQGRPVFLDVKDFDPPETISGGFFTFDPYPKVREKVEQARDKFKEYKEYCCAVVLRNLGNPTVDLEFPQIMLGVMYGDSGFQFPFDPQTGQGHAELMQHAFLGRGKMIRPHWREPQNTTISALITLTRFRPDFHLLSETLKTNRGLSIEDGVVELEARDPNFDPERFVPRVIVWHNAVARIPFPADLFCGPYDCHFGVIPDERGMEQGITYRGVRLPANVNPKLPQKEHQKDE